MLSDINYVNIINSTYIPTLLLSLCRNNLLSFLLKLAATVNKFCNLVDQILLRLCRLKRDALKIKPVNFLCYLCVMVSVCIMVMERLFYRNIRFIVIWNFHWNAQRVVPRNVKRFIVSTGFPCFYWLQVLMTMGSSIYHKDPLSSLIIFSPIKIPNIKWKYSIIVLYRLFLVWFQYL